MTQKESLVIKAHQELRTIKEVSKHLKIPRTTVRSILFKYNLINSYKQRGQSKKLKVKKPKPVFTTRQSEYGIWRLMNRRCHDPNKDKYSRYGGRGITVYQPWRTSYYLFCLYLNSTIGMRPSEAHTLDRILEDKGYEPSNLQWLTMPEQCQKRTNNKLNSQLVKYIRQQRDTTNKTIRDVSIELGISWQNVYGVWKDNTWRNII